MFVAQENHVFTLEQPSLLAKNKKSILRIKKFGRIA
jgi:hypothetical protein